MRALLEVPVTAADVVVDVGAGLGKVLLVTRLLTGARVRGIELQPALAARARSVAEANGLDVDIVEGDAREVDLEGGTVFFLYVPFTGPVLATFLERLRGVAARRSIVVCTLGFDVDREAPWLARRPLDAFWLNVYDSAIPGVLPGPRPSFAPFRGAAAEAIAYGRSLR